MCVSNIRVHIYTVWIHAYVCCWYYTNACFKNVYPINFLSAWFWLFSVLLFSQRKKTTLYQTQNPKWVVLCMCFFVVFLMRVVVWWCFILGTYTYMYMRVLFNVKMRAPSILAAAVRCGVVSIKRIIDRCVYNFWTVRRERGSFSFYTRAHTFYIIYTSYFEYMYVHAVWDFIIFIKTNTYSHTHTATLKQYIRKLVVYDGL